MNKRSTEDERARLHVVQSSADEYEIAQPEPAALVESLRAFGYTTETAIADLIDNSLSAGSHNIWVEFDWDGPKSRLAVRDDGSGMTESELVNAMRPGSRSPLEERSSKDLGRFGLGLKTASFSQCRRLTVGTAVRGGAIAVRSWDLGVIERTHEWRLLKDASNDAQRRIANLERQRSGTAVVWESVDRILGTEDQDDEDAMHRRFLELARRVREHLSVTFHRFMTGRGAVTFHINGRGIEPWDPFLITEKGHQSLEQEVLPYRGEEVAVHAHVLPHRSKLSTEAFERAGLHGRWNDLQGFYVYRNRRLLVAGNYLGLGFQKEEHYKLARIAVDITNRLDSDWQIDVRKSQARPPNVLRDELKRVAAVTRARASEVYRHRGKALTKLVSEGLTPTWEQRVRHGKISYSINRKHPLVAEAVRGTPEQRRRVKAMLNLVEETVPVPLIAITTAERPEQQAVPFDGMDAQLRKVAAELFAALRRDGLSKPAARKRLATIEPFHLYPEIVATINEDNSEAEEEPA